MAEVTTTIRVTITVHEDDPRDPKDWALAIQDHLWETFNADGSLTSVEYVPEGRPNDRGQSVARQR